MSLEDTTIYQHSINASLASVEASAHREASGRRSFTAAQATHQHYLVLKRVK